MPELPEVETVRRGLQDWVVGRQISQVQVQHPRAVRRHLPGPTHFVAALVGRTPQAAQRRGKYLWLPLDQPATGALSGEAVALVAHLGMSGQMLIRPAEAVDEIHLRVRVRFADSGPELRFVDQRTFGGLSVSRAPAGVPEEIAHIALDPLDPLFDEAAFLARLRLRRTEVKRALLDQSLVGGVGNIYADEALWRAKVHGARPADQLTRPAAARLLAHVRDVLGEALQVGGTSFDALYVDVDGQSGYFGRSLQAYGREGLPCTRCAAPIRREAFMNRSSFFCPHCQPRPRR